MKTLYLISTAIFLAAITGIWTGSMLMPAPVQAQAQAPTQGANLNRTYTMTEVARHARSGDCWMVISGNVYDLSAYLPQHPTPPSVMLPYRGKEATQAYKTKNRNRPHSPYSDELLAKYKIGVLKN